MFCGRHSDWRLKDLRIQRNIPVQHQNTKAVKKEKKQHSLVREKWHEIDVNLYVSISSSIFYPFNMRSFCRICSSYYEQILMVQPAKIQKLQPDDSFPYHKVTANSELLDNLWISESPLCGVDNSVFQCFLRGGKSNHQ